MGVVMRCVGVQQRGATHGLQIKAPSVCRASAQAAVNVQLNEAPYCPHRDYKSNRLVPGRLQLAARTQVLLDETVMTSGQLQANGIVNLQVGFCSNNLKNLFWYFLNTFDKYLKNPHQPLLTSACLTPSIRKGVLSPYVVRVGVDTVR